LSRAGQAGEIGSVFRCAVATHLAVHGLRSRLVTGLDLPSGVDPIRLDFETNDPTDDIRATFSDGRRAYVSAKRKVTRGRPLVETVTDWVAQVATLGPDDLLVIAGEEFAGPVRNLDRVLRRHRAGLPMETSDERDALSALTDLLPEEMCDLVLERARVLHLPDSTGIAASRDLLAALMDFVVADAQGQRAVSTLSDLFHRQAGDALGSGIDDWVVALQNAGLTVIADRGGPAGMRMAARLSAISDYSGRLKADAGRIDLSLLAEDLPLVIVDNLLDGIEIKVEGEIVTSDLLRNLRRWRRMLIVGQPGSGKSVALREIAAHCATHPNAPVPIRVSLPRLIKRQADRLTIGGIIDVATADSVIEDQRPPLAEYLAEELANGRAILLFDGLDECGVRAPWVAQELANILKSLHPRAGFVLATRVSAQISAARVGLPRVDLASPSDLSKTVDRVLVACADTRIAETERATWLAARRAWINEAKKQHDHLLAIPLLAVLLTLICADASDAELPKGRATLLHRAVQQSVRKWEQTRETIDAIRPWSPALTTSVLLDGFIVLGRMLDGGETPSHSDVLEALNLMLNDRGRWAMPPAQAHEVAEEVLRFWDEHVAVFVLNAAGELTTRSKVFAEIATAMWAKTCEQEQLRRWLSDALAYTDSDGAIALAAGLDPRVIGELLAVCADGRPEAALTVADLAIRGIVTLASSELELTLGHLEAGVVAARKGGRLAKRGPRHASTRFPNFQGEIQAPGAWQFVQTACLLTVPPELRRQRARLVAIAALKEQSQVVAAALCNLIDATTDDRQLSEAEAASVNDALEIPLPPKMTTVPRGRRKVAIVGGGRLVPGLVHVALAASSRLDELAEGSDERLFQIAKRATLDPANRIFAALARAGVDTSQRWEFFGAEFNDWLSADKIHEAALLADLISLADPGSPSNDDRLWSLTDVGDLLTATGYRDIGLDEFHRAFLYDSEQTRRSWLDAIADAYGIDKAAVASQAYHMQQVSQDAKAISDNWFVASAKPLSERSLSINLDAVLTDEQKRSLLSALKADSGWIACAAAVVVINLSAPPWDSRELFENDMSGWPRWRSGLLHMVAILTARDYRELLLARAAASGSADYRYAARMTIETTPDLDPDGLIMQALRRDVDLSVRPKDARKEPPAPTHWTCDKCRAANDPDVEDCSACDDDRRPEI
jgi:hypothetical protein